MADSTHEERTGFADLSAELRNKIYRLVPTTDEEHDEVELYSPHEEQVTPPRTICPNILRTCRFVHAEATSILYGENIFNATAPTLCDWIAQIGPNKQLVRLIVIELEPKHVDLRRALKSLATLPRLCELEIGWNPFSKSDRFPAEIETNAFAKILWPLLRAYYKRKGHDAKATLEFLQFWDVEDNMQDPGKRKRFSAQVEGFRKGIARRLEDQDRTEWLFKAASIALDHTVIAAAQDIASRRQNASAAADLPSDTANDRELSSDGGGNANSAPLEDLDSQGLNPYNELEVTPDMLNAFCKVGAILSAKYGI